MFFVEYIPHAANCGMPQVSPTTPLLLQESNFTAQQPRRAPVTLYIFLTNASA